VLGDLYVLVLATAAARMVVVEETVNRGAGRRRGANNMEERGRRNGGPVRGDVGVAFWTGEGGGGAKGSGEAAVCYVRFRRASK
jgi:hypothetical protein